MTPAVLDRASLRRSLLPAVAASLLVPGVASAIDFAQFDVAEKTRTLVLVQGLRDGKAETPDPLVTAAYTRFPTGSTASVGYMHRWSLVSGTHNWLVGGGAGLNHYRADNGGDDRTGLSARAQTEFFGPAPGGAYYALVQVSSFRRAAFASAQYNPSNSRLGFELARYRETDYQHTAAAARWALDSANRWFLRLGVIRADGDNRPFVGLAYNAF